MNRLKKLAESASDKTMRITRSTLSKIASKATPQTAWAIAAGAARVLPVMLLTAGIAAAQTGGGGGGTDGDGSVQGALNAAVNTFYEQWRFPISAMGVILAIGLYLSDNPRARSWSLKILFAVLFWALAPSVLDILFDWAGTGNSFNLGGGK